jgi:hypothetical protein
MTRTFKADADIPDEEIESVVGHVPMSDISPETSDPDSVKVYYVVPAYPGDPLFTTNIVGVKWVAEDGDQYGEIMYLPPKVAEAFIKHMAEIAKTLD